MNKWIKFVDTAGSDEHLVPLHSVGSIFVTAATTVIVYFHGIDSWSGGTTFSFVTLTVTSGKSDEVAAEIAKNLAIGRGHLYTISTDHNDISTVAYTEGS